jgi:hypothetical protein
MNVPESFYIALCVTILMLGVVYWFWTQIQYVQRKLNLLENVVYEMKTLVANLPGPGGGGGGDVAPPFTAEPTYPPPVDNEQPPYAPPPESVAGDIEAERMASEVEFPDFAGEKRYSEPVEEPVVEQAPARGGEENDDLQPGGLASAAVDTEAKKRSETEAALDSPLNSLSIKELRRMAEANNIPGASEMRKRDLVRVLRNKVSNIINSGEQPQVISLDSIGAPNSD